jgi:hypothetical protein
VKHCVNLINNHSDFYFRSQFYEQSIIWDWKEEIRHEAWNWTTWMPKESHLMIKSKLPKGLMPKIRKELYESIMESEHPKPKKVPKIRQL